MDQYQKFRDLLNDTYQFPCTYPHKFIGKNSPIFWASVAEFEKKFIGLTLVSKRESASGKHTSLTYDYLAANAEEIIQLCIETNKLNDVIYIL